MTNAKVANANATNINATNTNIKDFLEAAGYDVMGARVTRLDSGWRHEYDIRFKLEEIERKLKEIEKNGGYYEIDLNDTFTVVVSEVGFNGWGGLYIVLDTLDGECFDVIEESPSIDNFWIIAWIAIGNKNPWIREACDPPFDIDSFRECISFDEMWKYLEHGNWSLGQAFYCGDICLINQVNAGDEWLVIKQDTPFESYTTQAMSKSEFLNRMERISKASLEQCKALEY